MTLPKFLFIQVILLIGILTLTVVTRHVQVMQVDYNQYLREGIKEKYEFVKLNNYNQWVTGGIYEPTTLDKSNILGQVTSRQYRESKDTDLGLKLEGFKYDLESLTYDDIFYEDPELYADVYFVAVFVVYGLVLEIGVLRLLKNNGKLEWYSDRDMSYWV